MKVEKKIIDERGIKYLVSGAPDHFNVGDKLKVQTEEDEGTDKQNKLFHKLLHEIYKSRAWSFAGLSEVEHEGMSWLHFRDIVKMEFGEGADYYVYQDHFGHIKYDKKRPNPQICKACFAVPISWSKYTKEQRRMCIERVLSWSEEMGLGYLADDIIKEGSK